MTSIGSSIEEGQGTPPATTAVAAARGPHASVVATAWITAFVGLALIDAVLGPALAPPRTASLLALRSVYGVATLFALGVAFAAPVSLGAWLADRARAPLAATLAAYAVAGTGVAYVVIERPLSRQSHAAFEGRFALPLFVAFLVSVGAIPAAAHALGHLASRRAWLRALAVLVGAGVAVGNHALYRDDFPEVHGVVGVSSALFAGAAFAPWLLPRLAARPRALRALLGVFTAFALLAGVGPTPNAARKELFRSPGAAGAWFLASTRWEVEGLPPPEVPSEGARFFRRPLPTDAPIPPTSPALPHQGPPVVVFITIDAVRADALADRSRDATWPAIAALREGSASFVNARSPGSQTAVSLTATFAGKLFSEMHWGRYGVGSARFEYAAKDASPRFPELLRAEGVHTTKAVGVNFLANEYGTAAGFEREEVVPEGRKHAKAREVETELFKQIRAQQSGPLFAYAHFMEPHAPYDRGAVRGGSKRDRYLSEIAAMDGSIARLVELLDGPRFRNRSWLVVSSDHGEAFGEHGYWEHSKSLYDEMIRVPLIIRGPGVVARTLETPVSSMDVGPTVLDLFGVPTPASFEGQTLVPLLRGAEVPSLERPILSEGRLRRAIVMPDGMKVTIDLRCKTVEAFDLGVDPLERFDVWESGAPRARRAAAVLEAYFAARGVGTPIYKP